VTTVALLQELLHRQHGFQRHYAGSVDGCGLKLEADVRRAYYALLRRLIESVREHSQTAQQPGSVNFAKNSNWVRLKVSKTSPTTVRAAWRIFSY